jgi:hypothetical protein
MTVPDADRERVIAILREQVGEGRLDLDEFGTRLSEAYQAQSVAELNHSLRELPVPRLSTGISTPGGLVENGDERGRRAGAAGATTRGANADRQRHEHPHPRPGPGGGERVARAAWGAHLGSYLSVNAMLIVIWLIFGGPSSFFWPMFPIMGWGIGLAAHGMAHSQAMRSAESRRRDRGLPPPTA